MPGKPKVLRLPRYSMIIAAAALLVLMVAWVAVRSVGPAQDQTPTLIVPKPTGSVVPAAAVIPSPAASAPASTSVSLAADAGAVSLSPSSPTPASSSSSAPAAARSSTAPAPATPSSATPSRTPAKPSSPAPAPTVLSVDYRTGASWDRGFIGWVRVTNDGTTAADWAVSVTYPARSGVKVTGSWNARLDGSGGAVTFSGGPLAPGASADFGFQATKESSRKVSPSSCSVTGGTCRVG